MGTPEPRSQPAEDHLVDARGQRRRGGVDRRGIAAQRDGDLHAASPRSSAQPLVLGRALVDLPVHAERALIEDLEPVHAHVARARHGVRREHHRQRDEAPRVPRPAAQHGQRGEAGRSVSTTSWQGAERTRLGPALATSKRSPSFLSLSTMRARHPQVEELRDARGELVEVLDAERRRHALGRAEGVDEHRHVEALDFSNRRAWLLLGRALRDAVRDLGDLEVAGDARRARA